MKFENFIAPLNTLHEICKSKSFECEIYDTNLTLYMYLENEKELDIFDDNLDNLDHKRIEITENYFKYTLNGNLFVYIHIKEDNTIGG